MQSAVIIHDSAGDRRKGEGGAREELLLWGPMGWV